jgi:hypothetical protein
VNRFVFASLACCLITGCDWINAGLADHPSGAQADALGDVFTSIGAFVKVAADPASASTDDLADLHATDPYRRVLDPTTTARRGDRVATALGACVTIEGSTASWNCPLQVGARPCIAAGSGGEASDGTISGTSTLTCEGTATAITVTASNIVFDKVLGKGGGKLTVTTSDPSPGLATVDIDGLGFCTEQAKPAPNTGTVTIDGQGPLEGLPFDPLTLSFSDVPECGVASIED